MSIPKEPRQLMINIMYLVLTAMLALNVSAEIFNAFRVVNKGLQTSNASLDKANQSLPEAIRKFSTKEDKFKEYPALAEQTIKLSKEFNTFVDGIWTTLETESGGRDPETGLLKGERNKDITTHLLVNEGKGEELKNKIIDYRKKFEDIVKRVDPKDVGTKVNISMSVDDETWKGTDKKSWADYNFRQMPLGALEPMFSKFKNDAKSTEAAILNYLLGKVGATESVVLDQFRVVSAPKKSYIIEGEPYEAEVFLSASASAASNTGISISINGANMPLKDGVAMYKATGSGTGIKKYTATASVKNPVTGKVTPYTSTFEYEVGRRSVAVSADMMNVFYIGVDNPVTISAAGVSSNQMTVNGSGGGLTLKSEGGSKYMARVTTPGDAKITVSAPGMQASSFPFRVKRIPDPKAKMGKKDGGRMGSGEMKAQGGLIAELENFDFNARCDIVGFEMTYVAKRQDPVTATNNGGKFGDAVVRLTNSAKPGDTYYFDEVKAKCPGDGSARKINSMIFRIQ